MINYYKTIDDTLIFYNKPEPGCWISVESPTNSEIEFLVNDLGINRDFVISSLDSKERSHTDKEDDQTLVILDMPVSNESARKNDPPYYTIPVGFIVSPEYIVTVTGAVSPIFNEIVEGKIKGINTAHKTHFIFATTFRIANHFIMHLKYIDQLADQTEQALQRSMKNEQLTQLLGLEKSLVYFSTSLKATEATLEKILRGRVLKLYEEDQDLLEDTLIEIKQAIDNATIYLNIIDSIMDTTASIISNNLNLIMKVMTSITIVLTIPDLIFGFYGMNVPLPFENKASFLLPTLTSIVIGALCAYFLYKKGFFDI